MSYLLHLVDSGVPANQILILVPQRTLARPYRELIRQPRFPGGGVPDTITLGGLAQRMIALFWPLIAQEAGFSHPDRQPTFLTLETAQYFLAKLVKPFLDQGYFETIHVDRNRLLSQILDNLNKAAAVGFPHIRIADRLKTAWIGKPEQLRAYEEAQDIANRFRQFCLENNTLDFSLQIEVFIHHLWPSFLCREYLFKTYRHLIFDNIEEDIPVTHGIIAQWLPQFESALLIYDTGGGYRSFLGADPETGWELQSYCDQVIPFTQSWVNSPALDIFRQSLSSAIKRQELDMVNPHIRSVFQTARQPFYPQLLDWVTKEVERLVTEQQTPPGEITILAPFLSDSLRFQLVNRLTRSGVPVRSHRPSRSLREEPATRCLLTLARLAHPQWKLACSHYDVRLALMQSLGDTIDLIRADILIKIVYRPNHFEDGLGSFDKIIPETQKRISYQVGERYNLLQQWLSEYRQQEPIDLDVFLSRIFGEVLSQPGFGFYQNIDDSTVAARLIESIQKFRKAASEHLSQQYLPIGSEYIRMVEEGVIAAQYLQEWEENDTNAVFIAPAYTFLIANQAVQYQFWLDIGSLGWWERLYQPLTHPIVLSRHWPEGKVWTDADEYAANQHTLDLLVSGLIRRCRGKIYLCSSGVNEQGDEPRGPLLQATQMILRRLSYQEGDHANSF